MHALTRVCRTCAVEKDLATGFFKGARSPGGFHTECRLCLQHRSRKWREDNQDRCRGREGRWRSDNRARVMLYSAANRAKKQGVPFSLTADDIEIPERCPVLDIPMAHGDGKAGPNSPSLDKLVPILGYVPGNIRVISARANMLKNDATVEEMERVLEYLRRIYTDPPTTGGTQ